MQQMHNLFINLTIILCKSGEKYFKLISLRMHFLFQINQSQDVSPQDKQIFSLKMTIFWNAAHSSLVDTD